MTHVERDRLASIEAGIRQLRKHVLKGHPPEQVARDLLISAGELRRLREASCRGSETSSKI